jgi:hypothetical protein
MSDNTKRTREAHSGINIQIRFVPEERTHSEKEATISVQCDETKKGSPDNLRQITLPQLAHLGGHGEMFVTNRYKLQTAIFNYKGWNGPEWFKKEDEYPHADLCGNCHDQYVCDAEESKKGIP